MDMKAFGDFESELSKYPSMWDCVELKVVAGKRNGAFILLALQGFASTAITPEAGPYGETLFETPDIVMAREITPFGKLPELVQAIKTGNNVSAAGIVASPASFQQFQCVSYPGGFGGEVDVKYPYTLLRSYGKTVYELIDEGGVNRNLLHWGYRSLDEVSQDKLGFAVGGSYSTRICFVLPILAECTVSFTGNDLDIQLSAHASLKPETFHASYEAIWQMVPGRTERHRDNFRFANDDLVNEEAGFYSAEKTVKLGVEVRSAVVWLFHEGREQPLYTLTAIKPLPPEAMESNPLWISLQLLLTKYKDGKLVPGADTFRAKLLLATDSAKDANRFEAAVMNLMSIAGFVCLFTGNAFAIPGVDLLAASPDMKGVCLISVTVANDIGDKLRTLKPQMNRLKERLKDVTFYPAIFAAIKPDDVMQSDVRKAAEEGVKLVLLPELEEILRIATTSSPTDAMTSVLALLAQQASPF